MRTASARRQELAIHLIDSRRQGRGVAYGTRDPSHRLNVPAAGMSALADVPDHFVRWLAEHDLPYGADDFAERRLYARYLNDILDAARGDAAAGVTLVAHHADATALDASGGGPLTVELSEGESVVADAAVLALGNAAPGRLPQLDGEPRVVDDPWAPGALAPIVRTTGRVLLVGSGLTMVDVALTLSRRCPGAELVAISRNGLLPRPHADEPLRPHEPAIRPYPEIRLEDVVGAVQGAIDRSPDEWREVVDGMRPVTRGIWSALPLEDRRRFLEQYAREWEVRRHRTAPAVRGELDRLFDSGRLSLRRGRLRACNPRARGRVTACIEHNRNVATLDVDWVVNCTGPDVSVERSEQPLVRGLLASGKARPHPLDLGFDVDSDGRLVSARGEADPRLVTIGPLRRGALLETTSVPEIREQAADAAELILSGEYEPVRPAPLPLP